MNTLPSQQEINALNTLDELLRHAHDDNQRSEQPVSYRDVTSLIDYPPDLDSRKTIEKDGKTYLELGYTHSGNEAGEKKRNDLVEEFQEAVKSISSNSDLRKTLVEIALLTDEIYQKEVLNYVTDFYERVSDDLVDSSRLYEYESPKEDQSGESDDPPGPEQPPLSSHELGNDPQINTNSQSISKSALDAVVAAGLAAVLQAASQTPAIDRASAAMVSLFDSDRSKYGSWSANDWVAHCKAAKRTILKTEAWAVIKAWRAEREPEKQRAAVPKAVPKKTRK